jgi:hypothetical protein|tara:strand:- start:421 stop:606 length:186 start_codon:yes stop_codon:yes gene_type:complete
MKINKNNPGQGKTQKQYKDSTKFAGYSIIGMIILLIIMTLLGGCTTTKECCEKDHTINLDK